MAGWEPPPNGRRGTREPSVQRTSAPASRFAVFFRPQESTVPLSDGVLVSSLLALNFLGEGLRNAWDVLSGN